VAEHGVAITTRMYELLFERHPEVRALFDAGPGVQEKRLAEAVLAYARNIDNLDALTPAVQNIAAKHVAKGVTPDQYPVVGTILLEAMGDILGDVLGGLDPAVISAWSEAYTYLADVFIGVEQELVSAAAVES
jgi:nitric oxide dioxygenase